MVAPELLVHVWAGSRANNMFFFFGGLFVFVPISYESPTSAAPTLLEWSMGGRRKTPIPMPAITAT